MKTYFDQEYGKTDKIEQDLEVVKETVRMNDSTLVNKMDALAKTVKDLEKKIEEVNGIIRTSEGKYSRELK